MFIGNGEKRADGRRKHMETNTESCGARGRRGGQVNDGGTDDPLTCAASLAVGSDPWSSPSPPSN